MEPEQALEAARRAAAERRGSGGPPPAQADAGPPSPGELPAAQLTEWALIEPDLREVRSTRRLGAPVTALKQALLRILGQYHAELTSQQTRFNVNLLGQVRALERRVEELERRLGDR
jgi:hypothetical protein